MARPRLNFVLDESSLADLLWLCTRLRKNKSEIVRMALNDLRSYIARKDIENQILNRDCGIGGV